MHYKNYSKRFGKKQQKGGRKIDKKGLKGDG